MVDGSFQDISLQSGTAFSGQGLAQAGMGVDAADLGNGYSSIHVTNYSLENNNLYWNYGSGTFTDQIIESRLAGSSFVPLGFWDQLVRLQQRRVTRSLCGQRTCLGEHPSGSTQYGIPSDEPVVSLPRSGHVLRSGPPGRAAISNIRTFPAARQLVISIMMAGWIYW